MNLNKIFLIGNLTKNVELKTLASGNKVTNFRIAVSREFKKEDGVVVKEVLYVDIDIWGSQAESCAKFLSKGSCVHVEGRLVYDTWEKEGGTKGERYKVNADRVQFLDKKIMETEINEI